MQETPMLFPMAPGEFWKQIKSTIEEVVKANMNQTAFQPPTDHLPEKALLRQAMYVRYSRYPNQHSMTG